MTELLRNRIHIALSASAIAVVSLARPAPAAPPSKSLSTIKLLSAGESSSVIDATQSVHTANGDSSMVPPAALPELGPANLPPQLQELPPAIEQTQPMYEPPESLDEYATGANIEPEQVTPSETFFSRLKWLGLRHASVDGRNAGMGVPLVGTSWLNRPYYFGIDLGTVWITDRVQPDVTRDIDMYGGIYGGWDWDYYWGTELSIQRATPELINEHARDANRGDRMMIYTASLLYYPWGDSLYRPYWRCGIGEMDIDFPTDSGHRRDESLWTFPVGIGIKYPVRRWLAARAEFADQIGVGNSGVAAQHDLTLTFALEWRFGAHPRSYWPWNPSRHIW